MNFAYLEGNLDEGLFGTLFRSACRPTVRGVSTSLFSDMHANFDQASAFHVCRFYQYLDSPDRSQHRPQCIIVSSTSILNSTRSSSAEDWFVHGPDDLWGARPSLASIACACEKKLGEQLLRLAASGSVARFLAIPTTSAFCLSLEHSGSLPEGLGRCLT